ncbi:YusW family protein [Alkalihalobacillus sp. MEB130]|uniref:YusW family protein n=1 Tax=Alkalihalobacillus sp. MEB130 TaxID=2976704 RepID=UPI0028E01B33|nr:YusW family protein [Alkalihalobacillus sp. MEB130]MDT8859720.1 YusW family protein [Alkalihalobacillus sp. MEB130]
MKRNSMMVAAILTFLLVGFISLDHAQASPTIIDFELEIELKDGTEYEIEYDVKKNQIEAKYAVPGEVVTYGQEALPKIEQIFKQVNLVPNVEKDVVIKELLNVFHIDRKAVSEFELDVKFDGGQRIKIDEKTL